MNGTELPAFYVGKLGTSGRGSTHSGPGNSALRLVGLREEGYLVSGISLSPQSTISNLPESRVSPWNRSDYGRKTFTLLPLRTGPSVSRNPCLGL